MRLVLNCSVAMFLISIFFGGNCYGVTIYVDQSGGGDYTTISAAINAAYPDDVLMVGPGVYEEQVIINKSIKLIGSGPKYTTLLNSTGNTVIVGQTVITELFGFTITSGNNGVDISDYTNVLIRNCVIVSCSNMGIRFYGRDGNISIINSTIAYNNDDGIYLYGTYSSHCSASGNIIVFNGDNGIHMTCAVSENVSYNNIFGNIDDYDGVSAGTGDISFNPLFIDQPSGNYVLQSSSNCINSGIPGEPYNDPDGSRNDMGAYSGTGSAAFWPYIPNGPVVTNIELIPASVPRGGTLTIRAKGRVQ